MSHENQSNHTCYDVLSDVDAAIRAAILPEHEYYVLGGIVTNALIDQTSVIDTASSSLIAGENSSATLKRENGTRRDIDILVGTILSNDDAARIRANVQDAVEDSLAVSVFGFDQHDEDRTLKSRLKKTVKAWSSQRTIDEKGIIRYELFPLSNKVQAESFIPWRLELPSGNDLQMFHPAGHALAYSMRSISSVRPKDQAKYNAMRIRIDGPFRQEVQDGLFREWKEFASDIHLLYAGGHRSILSYGNSQTALWERLAFTRKGRFLHSVESVDTLVNIAQQEWLQDGILKRVTGNR